MKKNNLMIALVLSAGLLFGACGSNEPKETATEAPAAEKVINTTHAYICPMNCVGSASMDPGQCKVCGMDLVKNPNYAGAAADTTATADTSNGEKTEAHDHDDHEGHNH